MNRNLPGTSVSTILKMMFQKDHFFLLFLLPSSTYCGTFLYIEPGFFFDLLSTPPPPPNSTASFFFLRENLKILNPACNIFAVILVGPISHLFILKLSSYILIPSKEDTV